MGAKRRARVADKREKRQNKKREKREYKLAKKTLKAGTKAARYNKQEVTAGETGQTDFQAAIKGAADVSDHLIDAGGKVASGYLTQKNNAGLTVADSDTSTTANTTAGSGNNISSASDKKSNSMIIIGIIGAILLFIFTGKKRK